MSGQATLREMSIPSVILASQYRVQSVCDGWLVNLSRAMLEAALNELEGHGTRNSGRSRHGDEKMRQRVEAREWIERSGMWPFSFEAVCFVLGLDADWIRRGMRAREGQGRRLERLATRRRGKFSVNLNKVRAA